MSTASWLAASASSRRPRLDRSPPSVVQAHRQIRQESVGPGFGKAPVNVHRLLAGRQRLLTPSKLGQADTECASARRQVVQERQFLFIVGALRGIGGGQPASCEFGAPLCNGQREVHQGQRFQGQSAIQSGQRPVIEGRSLLSENALQRAARFDRNQDRVRG